MRGGEGMPDEDRRTAVERLLAERRASDEGAGRPIAGIALRRERSLESYFKAAGRPRWMERVIEVDRGIAAERRDLEAAYAALRAECGADLGEFARRWRAVAASWPFAEVNELIRQHNEWYPIERDLPMDPRTGEYVLIHGRNFKRPELGPAWVLEHFPPSL